MYFQSVNGIEIDQISTFDRGLAYGDGLFTTAKIVNGSVLILDQHIERLRHGCKALNIQGINFSTLKSDLIDIANGYEIAVLKVIVTAGEGGRGYSRQGASSPNIIIKTSEYPHKYNDWKISGITVSDATIQLGTNPLFSGLKHLNRLEQVFLREELDNTDFDDLFVYDLNHILVETTCANVFWFEGEQLLTPDIKNSGVSGLLRAEVLKCFPQTKIVHATSERIKQADAIFITNSVMEIVPVRQYQGKQLNMNIIKQLMVHFKQFNL